MQHEMTDLSTQTRREIDRIRTHATFLAGVTHSSYPGDEEARAALNEHGIPDEEIDRQLSTLSSNTADSVAVLTSYSLLHSLHHLDEINDRQPQLGVSADAVLALLRCAEICLHNMAVLADRMIANLEAGRLDRAVSNARWRAGFQEVLYRLSALAVEVSDDPAPGPFLHIHESRTFDAYRRASDVLQRGLMSSWSEDDSAIFGSDLDEPLRYISFNEFANTSDERIWLSRLSDVRVPGAVREAGESSAACYERLVCTEEIVRMLAALETEADTDLLPFRAVHQVAEVIASSVNRHLCDVIQQLTSPEALPHSVLRTLTVSNRLLSSVDDVMKLLMRALTPRAYEEVRPNLGMVQGTSSIVLRKTLFNRTYPLLVRAFKLRLCAFDPVSAADDAIVTRKAAVLAARAGEDPERQAEITVQLIVLNQHIRTWRDNHQQFPKTHLGVSAVPERPTVSLAGSDSGAHIAHALRRRHADDPIAPLYEAVIGTRPPDVHDLLTPGGYDEFMAHKTARAVLEVYAEVQERFYDRTRKISPITQEP